MSVGKPCLFLIRITRVSLRCRSKLNSSRWANRSALTSQTPPGGSTGAIRLWMAGLRPSVPAIFTDSSDIRLSCRSLLLEIGGFGSSRAANRQMW